MEWFARRVVLVLAFVFATPSLAATHDHDVSCDTTKTDVSKLSPEDKQAWLTKCTDQLRAENCGISGVDMSMISTDDQKAMKESCVVKMKHMGCDMKGVDVSKISATDAQKLMDQCHDKLVQPAAKSTSAPAALPTPKPQ